MNRTGNSDWPLFPYEPHSSQLKFMSDVKEVIGNQGIIVAEACNGFGKTVSSLTSILVLGKKIVYATRTHEQIRQVLFEVEHINRKAGIDFSAVNLASRQHLCLIEKCRKLNASEAQQTCKILRESGECTFKTEIESISNLPNILSIERLQKTGKSRRVCPYFLARRAVEDYTIVVAPYQYIFNKYIRSQVNLNLIGRVLIFDEAHNADRVGQDVLSDSISERTLDNAKNELDAVEASSDFIDDLTEFLDRKIHGKTTIEPGFRLHKDLQNILETNELSSFTDSYSLIVDKIRKYKMDQGDYPASYLQGVLNFISLIASSPLSSYAAIYRRTPPLAVEYRCLDPSLAIKPVVKDACGALIMSGTLSPLKLFSEVLGLEGAEMQTYSAIASPKNVRTMIDLSVTTSFAERNHEMVSHIGERISWLIPKIPNGALVFFPQRRFMLNALDNWKESGLIKEMDGSSILGGKSVFIEGIHATENRKIVEDYKKVSRIANGAILFGVFRGRNAEGSNFPDEEARGIFLVGIPYADFSNPVVNAQISYLEEKRPGLGKNWYIMDAFRAVNQAMGRGIRHRNDWCNFILMDKRYETKQDFLPKWVVANGVQIIERRRYPSFKEY